MVGAVLFFISIPRAGSQRWLVFGAVPVPQLAAAKRHIIPKRGVCNTADVACMDEHVGGGGEPDVVGGHYAGSVARLGFSMPVKIEMSVLRGSTGRKPAAA